MKTAVQRRFRIEPCTEAVALPFLNQITGDALIRGAVDRESYRDAVLIESVWENAKVAGEEDHSRQCDMNRSGKQQISPCRPLHRDSSLQDLQDLTGLEK